MEGNREPARSRALGHARDQDELDAIVTSIVKTVDPDVVTSLRAAPQEAETSSFSYC